VTIGIIYTFFTFALFELSSIVINTKLLQINEYWHKTLLFSSIWNDTVKYWLWFVVFKLDVKTIFNSNLHFYWAVHVRIMRESVYNNILLLDKITHSSHHCHSKKVPAHIQNITVCQHNLWLIGQMTTKALCVH